MSETALPTEIELIYEIMPCADVHSVTHQGKPPLPCSYFRKWGTYHSFDYEAEQPIPTGGILQKSVYAGREPLVAEALSGCRKAAIMAVGINPNLPGWWKANSVNPLFNDNQQFAHYFRYRATAKLDIPMADYVAFGGGPADVPFSNFTLAVPTDAAGFQTIPLELQEVTMYQNYQKLLFDLADKMGWANHKLSLGEDVSYGNMVACPSAKWLTSHDSSNPAMPPMTHDEQRGIVTECFHNKRYFLRQLFQSMPAVLMVFSQSTADVFIAEMAGNFTKGDPKIGDKIGDLLNREVRLRYNPGATGSAIEARVIFSPHITGTPALFAANRKKVLAQLVAEAQVGGLNLNPATGHLARPFGNCTLCPTMAIGPCDYAAELKPVGQLVSAVAEADAAPSQSEKAQNMAMLESFLAHGRQRTQASPQVASADAGLQKNSATDRTVDAWALAGRPDRDVT